MYEEMTYEAILEDMSDRVENDVDKREGSVIFDALAPCAYKLSEAYFNLSNLPNLVLGDTAVGEFLDRVVSGYGIKRKPATYAVRKITTNGTIDIGARWGINDTTYLITEVISNGVYKGICQQLGTIGNTYYGELEPVDFIGYVTATLGDIIIPGEDEETDDNLRQRFYNKVRTVSTSGNKNDYKNWALEVLGCGDAKVLPLWNGNGTVKVLVVDENMGVDTELPTVVYNYIEEVRPIGAIVTVESPMSVPINVTSNIVLDGTRTFAEVQSAFLVEFTAYLKDAVFEVYSISYAKIGSLLLSAPGVSDYNNFLVNNGTANIIVAENGIPVIGTITLTEVV